MRKESQTVGVKHFLKASSRGRSSNKWSFESDVEVKKEQLQSSE